MPNKFVPVNPGSDFKAATNQINRNFAELDREAVTKTFKGPNSTNAIIEGRLPDGKYGRLQSDPDGTRRILLGQAPDDGRQGFWITKSGKDVITELGG